MPGPLDSRALPARIRRLLAGADPRRLLNSPTAYRLLQNALARPGSDVDFVENYVRVTPGMALLDVGCGPGDLVGLLPRSVRYVGFDLSAAYIGAAQKRYGGRGRFFQSRLTPGLFPEQSFDVIIAKAIIHHLNDEEVDDLVALASSLLVEGGRLVTLDPCFAEGQSWLARSLVAADRGQHVRSPEEYSRLLNSRFTNLELHYRDDLMRVPYGHFIMSATR